MPTSPRSRKRLFLFYVLFWIGDHYRRWHNAYLIILTTVVIATAPVRVQAQAPAATTVTKADAQKVFEIISGDKAKTRVYCQMARLGRQIEQANEAGQKFDALFQRMYELGRKLGPEYAALVDGLQDVDPQSEVGQEISSTLDALDNLCGG